MNARVPLLLIGLLTLSCAPPPPLLEPKIGSADARHVVGLFIGHHAWEIHEDQGPPKTRQGISFYHYSVDAEDAGSRSDFYVSNQTGDLYQSDLTTVIQRAAVLRQNDEPPLPPGYVGDFRHGRADAQNSLIRLTETSVALSNDGGSVEAQIVKVIPEESGIILEVEGHLGDGQDAESRIEIDGSWRLHLSLQADVLTLESAEGPDRLDKGYAGVGYARVVPGGTP